MNDIFSQHIQRGELLLERRRFQEAEAEFRRALALQPDAGFVHAMLAHAILHQNDKKRNQEAYQEAHLGVTHEPENAFAYYVLGRSLCALNKLGAAEKILRKGVELAPDNADYHVYLGMVLLDLNRVPEAKREFALTLALDPEHHWGLYFSAILENARGTRSDAIKYTRQLLRASPDKAEPHVMTGEIFMKAGLNTSAENAFREALRIDPNNQEAYVGLQRTQRNASTRAHLVLQDFVQGLYRCRWFLPLLVMVVLSPLLRSCRLTEPKPDYNNIKHLIPDNGQKKMSKEEIIKWHTSNDSQER